MSLRFSYLTSTILAAALVAVGGASAAETPGSYYDAGGCTDGGCSGGGCTGGGCVDAGCGGGSDCHGGLFGGRHSWRMKDCGHTGHCRGPGFEGMDPHFNCGCNGSYNFPVPPLYTYMWPGMYKHQLMTEYDNPWRFPPIKPYTDEPYNTVPEEFLKQYPAKAQPPIIPLGTEASLGGLRRIQPVSAQGAVAGQSERTFRRSYTGVEPLSQKMERYYSSTSR